MIYLGDGPSDVPSMSLINSHDGITIGIVQEDRVDKKWALSYGRRALVTARPEFQEDGDAYTTILSAAREIANRSPTEVVPTIHSRSNNSRRPQCNNTELFLLRRNSCRRHGSPLGICGVFVAAVSLVVLVLQNDRILAYRDDETKPFGMLRFGGHIQEQSG